MLRLLPLILRNVLRHRRRSLLTLASSAVSLGLLALLVAIYQNFFYAADESPAAACRVICRHRVSLTQTLPASHQQRIRGVPGVVATSAWTWFAGTYKEPKDFFARFAVDADAIFGIQGDWTAPADQITAFVRGRTACAVAASIAKQYGMKLGDRVTIVGDIYPVTLELTVACIFQHPADNASLVFHREYLSELLPTTSDTRDAVGTYLIRTDTPADVPRVSRQIDAMFDNSPYPTRTESEKEFGRSFLAFLGNVKLFLAAICGAVTFTILLVSANTVAMGVRERTREIAILRTLGYRPGEILNLVLAESVLISLLGGVLGLGIGSMLAGGVSAASGGGLLSHGLQWQAAAFVLGTAALVGVLAALLPAVAASRKNVVESLRFVG